MYQGALASSDTGNYFRARHDRIRALSLILVFIIVTNIPIPLGKKSQNILYKITLILSFLVEVKLYMNNTEFWGLVALFLLLFRSIFVSLFWMFKVFIFTFQLFIVRHNTPPLLPFLCQPFAHHLCFLLFRSSSRLSCCFCFYANKMMRDAINKPEYLLVDPSLEILFTSLVNMTGDTFSPCVAPCFFIQGCNLQRTFANQRDYKFKM